MLVVVLMQKEMATYKAALELASILAQGVHTSFPSLRCFQQLATLPPVQPWSSHYPPHRAPLQGGYSLHISNLASI